MTLVIISLCVFLVYLTGMYVYFGIPASISDTYYKLEKRKKGAGWLFTAMCWAVAGTLLPAWLDMTPDTYQFTAFLACAGLLFVGAAPQFKLKLTGGVHYGSAAICVIFSQIWVGLTCWWLLPMVWGVFLIGMALHTLKEKEGNLITRFLSARPMFWVEIVSFMAVYSCVFIKLLQWI